MIGNKQHFLVAGATGLIGRALVAMLLENDAVAKVSVLVRNGYPVDHQKLNVIEVDYESLSESIIAPNVDGVYCCLGTTMANAGGKDAFRRVDYEYVVKLAVFTQRKKVNQFHVVSAAGASATSKLFYNKVKGRMEMEVKKLSKLRSIYIYQPSMLLGDRQEFRLMESIGKFLMGIFSFIIPKSSKAILDDQVAYSMMNHSLNPKKGVHVISNAEMIEKK